jgi:WD40 repeat protein
MTTASMSDFHPTGDWMVASTNTRLTFWPLAKKYPSVVDGYTNYFRPLAFSPDGTWLATSWGERLRLWPLPGSGRRDVRTLDLPNPVGATALAFDPESRYLFAVGAQDRAWVVPLDGSAPRMLQGFSEETLLFAAAVSPSGRFVATAFWYGQGQKTLRVWDVETGELRDFALPESERAATGAGESMTGYEQGIASLSFADDSTLYTAGDGGLRRWNLDTGSNQLISAAPSGYGLRGSLLAERGVGLTFKQPLTQALDCSQALHHDLTHATSEKISDFGECGLWRSPRSFALDPSGTVAANGDIEGVVRVGRLTGGESHLLLGHRGAIGAVAISPDLRWVATAGDDDTLRLWPMPDLSKPPLHRMPHDQLLAKLASLTNVRVLRDASSRAGWTVRLDPFPGWKNLPPSW